MSPFAYLAACRTVSLVVTAGSSNDTRCLPGLGTLDSLSHSQPAQSHRYDAKRGAEDVKLVHLCPEGASLSAAFEMQLRGRSAPGARASSSVGQIAYRTVPRRDVCTLSGERILPQAAPSFADAILFKSLGHC